MKRKIGAYEVDDSPVQPSLVSGSAPRGLARTGVNRIDGKALGKVSGKATGKAICNEGKKNRKTLAL